ncbi:hypothetical protein Z043_118634, partial [Scleropages formosus]
MGTAVPPFVCSFSTEGIVRIYDTDKQKNQVLKEWMAHDNAVFDIAWVPGEPKLVTASGDQMAKLWDVNAGEMLGIFKGHQCSLKSVAFTRQEKGSTCVPVEPRRAAPVENECLSFSAAVFCTGGRDGNIMIWDTRCSKKDGYYRQVKQISGAHNKVDRHTPSKTKRRRLPIRGMAPSVVSVASSPPSRSLSSSDSSGQAVKLCRVSSQDSQQSVTVVLFRDGNTLISSGAVDGTIKMWDLRKNYTAHHHDPVPLQMYLYPGYSGLTLDSTGSSLFSNCTDDNIYMFNLTGLRTAPVAVFSGHLNSSFYVKSSVSPDNQFLASGSSDHDAYIWKISDPKSPPVMLQGHSQEVTSVAWCPTDFTKIASCSDDNTVRIWRLNRRPGGTKPSAGETNLVGWACPKPALEAQRSSPLRTSELSPSKSPRATSLGLMLSPQAASCAPSGAELPLPSTTSTTFSSPSSKTRPASGSPRQRLTSSSIRDWITRTPGSPEARSPRSHGASPLKEIPRPSSQSCSQAAAPTLSQGRAKRRLETVAEGKPDCPEDSECDMELAPPVKRERGLSSGCRHIPEEQEHWKEGEAQMTEENEIPTSSRQTNKENSVPGGADWLSALGQKLRSGSVSPSHSRTTTGASKKQAQSSPRSMKKISSYFQKNAP